MKKSNLLFLPLAIFVIIGFFGTNIAHAQTYTSSADVMPALSQIVTTTSGIVSTINAGVTAEQNVMGELAGKFALVNDRLGMLLLTPVSAMTLDERAQLAQTLSAIGVTLSSTRDTLEVISAQDREYAGLLGEVSSVLVGVKSILSSI